VRRKGWAIGFTVSEVEFQYDMEMWRTTAIEGIDDRTGSGMPNAGLPSVSLELMS
jgi:hypothetical protein